jgi:hypothetical protein
MAGWANDKWCPDIWNKYVKELKAPLGTARICNLCGHSEIVRSGIGMGRGYGMREGNKARGRMIQHLKNDHNIDGGPE